MKGKFIVLIFVLCYFLAGCGTYAKFTYPSDAKNLVKLHEKPEYPLKVAVMPLEDKRDNVNNFAGFFLYLVPLVPYGTINYDRPDAAEMFNTIQRFEFTPSEDLAKAIATSLRYSNIFNDVYFSFGGDTENADLLITGNIISTKWQGKTYSYCLSVFGPALWYIGLPAGSSYNRLALELSLSRADTKETIWDYSFDKETTILGGFYYNWGHDAKGYSMLMEQGMNEAVKSLDQKLKTIQLEKIKRE